MKKIIFLLFFGLTYSADAILIEIKNDNSIPLGNVYNSSRILWEESAVLVPDGPCSVKTIRIYFSGDVPGKDTIWVCGFPTAGNLWPTEYIWSYNSLINPVEINYAGEPGWKDIDVSSLGLRSDGIDKIVIQHRMKASGPYFTYDSDGKSSAMSWYTDPITPNPNFYNIAGTLHYYPAGDYMVRLLVEYDYLDGDRSALPPQPKFTNINHIMGISGGGEISVVDFNQDSWDDIAIGGNIFQNNYSKSNTFANVTSELGIGSAVGTNWADFDNDGDVDVYVVRNGQYDFDKRMVINQDRIYKNYGDSGFAPVPNDEIFIKPYPNPSLDFSLPQQFENNDYFNPYNTCTPLWLDYNSDGLPDLFIANKRIEISGKPEIFTPDEIWLNIGNSKFVNKRNEANLQSGEPYIPGSSGSISGYYDCYGAAACDYNNDNLVDIFVANYRLAPDNLYKNLGNKSFDDVGTETGAKGVPTAAPYYFGHGMGCAWGDFNNDGWFDLCVGNLAHTDSRGLYSNPSLIFQNLGGDGEDKFIDVHYKMGLKFHEGNAGACWVDLDNDGWLDLWHGKYSGGYGTFYLNQGPPDYKLKDITWLINTFISDPWEGVSLDFDNDGDEDLLIKGQLMRNDLPHKGNWVELRLRGKPDEGVSMDALGTRIVVYSNNRSFYRNLYGTAAGTHSTQNSSCLHFGIGNSEIIDSIIIHYPNNKIHKIVNVKPNAIYYIDYMQNPIMNFLSTPALQFPENYSVNIQETTNLKWTKVEGATNYTVVIYNNYEMTEIDTVIELGDENSVEIKRHNGDVVYWRVRANGNEIYSSYSSLWCFVVGAPHTEKLQLIEPANDSKDVGTSIIFKWRKCEFPQLNFYPNINYQLQLSLDSNFSSIIYNDSSLRDTIINIKNIVKPATQIYWRAKPIIEKDTSQQWSEIYNFTTIALPGKIVLLTPEKDSIGIDLKGGFTWTEDELAENYWIQIAKDEGFTDLYINRQGIYQPFNALPRLKEETMYFWHIAGMNAAGIGPWSDTWKFTTKKVSGIVHNENIMESYIFIDPGQDIAHLLIRAKVNEKCVITLSNILGIELMKIFDGNLNDAESNIIFNINSLVSGTYFCIIKVRESHTFLKFNVIK